MEPGRVKGATGIRRLIEAVGHSFSGLAAAFRNEAAFRLEVVSALVMVPLGLWLGPTATAKALLVASVLLVLIVELLNSAVEAAVDRISPELHPLSKRAKDIGSAAVLLSLVNAAVVWGMVLLR